MTEQGAQKLTYGINTVILCMVLGLMLFFKIIEIPFLFYYSIPTAGVYLFGYYLISQKKLDIYVWMVYLWLTTYMGITTVCVGHDFGFHLYCMSMIPVMFVTEYISYKLEHKSLKAMPVCVGVVIFYLICTGYVLYNGPVYVRDNAIAGVFWFSNSLIVFGFLIFYTNWLIRTIVASEDRLTQMAHIDKLTGLYNRHYMMELLEKLTSDADGSVLAIADIDFFKKINDTYGHNAGDYVLQRMAELLKEAGKDAYVCRWGGEEFLILLSGHLVKDDIFEEIRKKVGRSEFSFEGREIHVTITIGVAYRKKDETIDRWIQRADEKLYYGKEHGRNQVVV